MASSPQLSGQSIVPRMRSESGWRSCTGGLAVLFCFFLFICYFFFNYFFEASLLFPFYTSLKILAGVSVGFPPLISKFTLSKCTLKLRTCIGTLLNLIVMKSNNQQFFLLMSIQSQKLSFSHNLYALVPCSTYSSCSI